MLSIHNLPKIRQNYPQTQGKYNIQSQILLALAQKITKTIQSQKQTKQSKKITNLIYGYKIKSYRVDENANLRALAYVFLYICFNNDQWKGLSSYILEEMSRNRQNYLRIKNWPHNYLSLLGKVTLNLLNQSRVQDIYHFVDKYFALIQFMVLFLRLMLWKVGFPSALDYRQFVPTQQAYPALLEHFKIKYHQKKPYYLFQCQGLFISEYEGFCVGNYSPFKAKLSLFSDKGQKEPNIDEFGNFSFKFLLSKKKQEKTTQINCQSERSITYDDLNLQEKTQLRERMEESDTQNQKSTIKILKDQISKCTCLEVKRQKINLNWRVYECNWVPPPAIKGKQISRASFRSWRGQRKLLEVRSMGNLSICP